MRASHAPMGSASAAGTLSGSSGKECHAAPRTGFWRRRANSFLRWPCEEHQDASCVVLTHLLDLEPMTG